MQINKKTNGAKIRSEFELNNSKRVFMSALGEVIKGHRERIGKTIYAISAEASVPRSTWRDIEFGVSNNTNIVTFCKISEALDLRPWDLLKEICEKIGKSFSFSDFEE